MPNIGTPMVDSANLTPAIPWYKFLITLWQGLSEEVNGTQTSPGTLDFVLGGDTNTTVSLQWGGTNTDPATGSVTVNFGPSFKSTLLAGPWLVHTQLTGLADANVVYGVAAGADHTSFTIYAMTVAGAAADAGFNWLAIGY